MTLEELQQMSDAELNELSAVKVMGWNVSKEDDGTDETFLKRFDGDTWHILSAEWNPTTDMNDAYSLLSQFMDWAISINHGLNDWICRLSEGYIEDAVNVSAECESLPRAITIASILAKGEGK